MVANILPAYCPPPPTLGMGSICQNSTFSEHGHAEYQIKSNHQMQQHGSKLFACRPLPDPVFWGQKVKIKNFQNMVMLHIRLKRITNAATDPTHLQTLRYKSSKCNFFRTLSYCISNSREPQMQQLGSKYLTRRPTPTHLTLGAKRSKLIFFRMVMLHNKVKGWSIEHHANTYSLLTHTLNLWVGLKGKINLIVVKLHIKLREKKYGLT